LKWLVIGGFGLLALIAGAWIAPGLIEDPGYVLIEVGGFRIRMSVVVLVAGVIAIWAALSLAVALVRLPGRAARRVRLARDRRNLDRGLLALSEGDWAGAERALARAMRGPESSTAGYLAAARAAQGQAADARRDEYLALADRRFGKRHFATALARARLLAGEGEHGEAVALLEQLHLKKPRHEGVLKLLIEGYQQTGRWHEVRLLVPAIRRAGIVTAERAAELESLAAARELESCGDAAELVKLHRALNRKLRERDEIAAAFAHRALELDRAELAEPVLRRRLDRELSETLLDLYARADDEDRAQRIRHCRAWLESHPEHAGVHLALGRLLLAGRDDEQAREHLEIAVRSAADPAAYAALGQVMDRAGRLEAATQCYRNALRLEHGRAPDPLPPPGHAG